MITLEQFFVEIFPRLHSFISMFVYTRDTLEEKTKCLVIEITGIPQDVRNIQKEEWSNLNNIQEWIRVIRTEDSIELEIDIRYLHKLPKQVIEKLKKNGIVEELNLNIQEYEGYIRDTNTVLDFFG